MRSGRAERAALVGAALLALAPAACGKKAPLRLPEDRPALEIAAPTARVREGQVTLDFLVPRHRLFPEREDPWVLARVLRASGAPGAEAVEVGAVLEPGGFAFEAPLAWTDREQPPGVYVYRVEFRDKVRRRRALSAPVRVSWERTPGTPQDLAAEGATRSVALRWVAPGGADEATRFAIYRREPPATAFTAISPEPVAGSGYQDSRVEPGREYCYAVRAVLTAGGVAVEGAATPEACARPVAEQPPPARRAP
jgi:predicted small lipoprotein YifL